MGPRTGSGQVRKPDLDVPPLGTERDGREDSRVQCRPRIRGSRAISVAALVSDNPAVSARGVCVLRCSRPPWNGGFSACDFDFADGPTGPIAAGGSRAFFFAWRVVFRL